MNARRRGGLERGGHDDDLDLTSGNASTSATSPSSVADPTEFAVLTTVVMQQGGESGANFDEGPRSTLEEEIIVPQPSAIFEQL